MNNYIDIILNPDSEMPLNWLLNAVYTKCHKALYNHDSSRIGVSFPQYKVTLGNVLRLHGSECDLATLQQKYWLGGMSGYCDVSAVLSVPEAVKYRTVSRKQAAMSQSKLNRLIKRGSIPEGDISLYKVKMYSQGLDNPYVELISGSNGHSHRRYLQFGGLQDRATIGDFDHFGLSRKATVPWF